LYQRYEYTPATNTFISQQLYQFAYNYNSWQLTSVLLTRSFTSLQAATGITTGFQVSGGV
jgi:hypothetical protein